jgi:phosphoesterase RecJ-like protein
LDNTELFHNTPIINIDHHTDNENFGQINYVNDKSSSTGEIIISIIESLSVDKPLLDRDIATCILTGILSDTASFQNPNTTSKSLTVAAQMIGAGADHQLIIRNLFKTQALSQLKAWGKILTKLQTKPSQKLAWATISLAELQEINATTEDVGGVLDALVKNLPDIDVVMLLTQHTDHIKGSLRSHAPININPIATELGGGGHPQASGFEMYEITLIEAEQKVLNTIEKHLSPSLHTPVTPPSSTNTDSTYSSIETPPTPNPLNSHQPSDMSKPTDYNDNLTPSQ